MWLHVALNNLAAKNWKTLGCTNPIYPLLWCFKTMYHQKVKIFIFIKTVLSQFLATLAIHERCCHHFHIKMHLFWNTYRKWWVCMSSSFTYSRWLTKSKQNRTVRPLFEWQNVCWCGVTNKAILNTRDHCDAENWVSNPLWLNYCSW